MDLLVSTGAGLTWCMFCAKAGLARGPSPMVYCFKPCTAGDERCGVSRKDPTGRR